MSGLGRGSYTGNFRIKVNKSSPILSWSSNQSFSIPTFEIPKWIRKLTPEMDRKMDHLSDEGLKRIQVAIQLMDQPSDPPTNSFSHQMMGI
jgi:hypothetical protein